jgi:hypothetical protein
VSLTASFRGSKVRQKIIHEKSKIYKNSQNADKIKESVGKCIIYRQLRDLPIFFLRKTKIFQKFIKTTKNFFGQNKKNACHMVLNDKSN